MQPTPIQPFSPSPVPSAQSPVPSSDQIAAILDSLSDPDSTPRQVAAAHNISLLTLSTFVARPDIQQHIANLESLAAARARTIATDHLPAAALALRTIVNEYNNAPSSPGPTGGGGRGSARPEGLTSEPLEVHDAHTPRRPSHTTACRAASLLYRIARIPRVPRLSEPGVSRILQRARPIPDEPKARPTLTASAATTHRRESPGPSTARAKSQAPPSNSTLEPEAPAHSAAPELEKPTGSPIGDPPAHSASSPAPLDPTPDPSLLPITPPPPFASIEDYLTHLEQLIAQETPDNPIKIPDEAHAILAALASNPGPAP